MSASILVNSSLEHLLISPGVMNIIFVLTCSGGATGFNFPAQRPFRLLLRYTRASSHPCARSRPSRCRPSSAVTLRLMRYLLSSPSPSYIKTLSQGPSLENQRRPVDLQGNAPPEHVSTKMMFMTPGEIRRCSSEELTRMLAETGKE